MIWIKVAYRPVAKGNHRKFSFLLSFEKEFTFNFYVYGSCNMWKCIAKFDYFSKIYKFG